MTLPVVMRPKLWLDIENVGRYAVVQYSSDWGVNEIPRATCVVSVGRLATTGITSAAIHKTLNRLRRGGKAKVYFRPSGEWDATRDWPAKDYVIFDGKLLGVGLQKVRGKIAIVISMVHWLAYMNESSTFSAQSHPSNPTDLTFNAVVESLTARSSGAPGDVINPYGMAVTAEADSVIATNALADLWGRAIKPMFCALAQTENVLLNLNLAVSCGLLDSGKNTRALSALSRIEGTSDSDSECDKALSCYTPPLNMLSDEDAIPQEVAESIAQSIRQEAIESFAHQTFWGKLLQYSAEFFFIVVPQVDKALVVPWAPGLRSLYCKDIKADEYDPINLGSETKRPLRGVATVSRRFDVTGAAGVPPEMSIGLGGCYAPDDLDDGMLLFMPVPAWLTGIVTSGIPVGRTTGSARRVAINSALMPSDVSADVADSGYGTDSATLWRTTSDLLNGFAHMLYVQESLRGRIGYVSGKLRFDIAPGSTVRVEGTDEQFITDSDFKQARIGTVARVSIDIDAEQPSARTSFQLHFCRTESENENDSTSIELHPLYRGENFNGAPLIDDLQFPNDECCS